MSIKRQVITDASGEPELDENGRVKVNVIVEPLPGEDIAHAVVTGKHARGVVTMSDGTPYDVTPEVIQVSERHAGSPIGFRIASKLAQDGVLTEAVHGEGYDGPAVVVVGDETAHYVAQAGAEHLPVGATAPAEPEGTPPAAE